MSELEQTEKSKDEQEKKEHRVPITVNGVKFEVLSGRRLVSELKKETNVPAAFELEQVVDGKLVPLADDSIVVIKAHEVFVSHPKDSKSS